MRMVAKYQGTCIKCRGKINVGDNIDWEKGVGAAHASCPAQSSPKAAQYIPEKIVMEEVFQVPDADKDTEVHASWDEGEYLSGYHVSDPSGILEKLKVCHYVSGWGTLLNDEIVQILGTKFTLRQVEDLVRPKLLEAAKAEYERKIKKRDENASKFEQARCENKPIALKQWSEECDGSTDECDIDNIVIYAMPDGSTKKVRSHTW